MAKKIYISPSDQTKNVYGAGNTNEAVQCRQIAQYLANALKRCGFETKLNLTATMAQRVTESNEWGADLHICIHTNAFNEKVTGTRLMSYDLKGEGYKACKAIFDVLAPITPGTSENISAHPELYEIRKATAPTAYLEIDFHDVDEIALWIIEHKEDIAEAICKGLCKYYNVTYKKSTTSQASGTEVRYKLLKDIPKGYRSETIDRLVKLGIIKGKSGHGEDLVIDLGEDAIRLLVINDRASLYPKS